MRNIRNTNVCVIGGCGFLGSHLVNHLIIDRHCTVLVLDNLIAGKLEFLNPKAIFEWCDITHSESELRKFFEKYKIEYVFNYAASPYIPVSFERPIHVFDINAVGALKVMNAAQDAGVKAVLQVSSAEIYGDAPKHKIDEKYPANPHSTYGSAKLAIDNLVTCRWKEAGTPVIALRQFNCVGENETHPYVIPEIIGQLSKSNTVWLGNNSFRDFQYAGDAVRMAVELLEKGNFGEVYNMGSEDGIQIYDLAELIGHLMGHKEVIIELDHSKIRPYEIWWLQSDNTKLYSVIDYRPKTTLEESLKLVIIDYKKNGFSYE
jgi:UDP-glucose 4-epimerase